MSTIDLNNPPNNHRYKLSVEREETDAERYVRLFKDIALFTAAIGFVAAIFFLAFQVTTDASAAAEEKKWAMAILSGAASGLVGYLVRK